MIDDKELLSKVSLTIAYILSKYRNRMDGEDISRLARHLSDYTRLQIERESKSALDTLREKGLL